MSNKFPVVLERTNVNGHNIVLKDLGYTQNEDEVYDDERYQVSYPGEYGTEYDLYDDIISARKAYEETVEHARVYGNPVAQGEYDDAWDTDNGGIEEDHEM